ncbi:putative mannosyl-oligosaccharide alpha-1,2-mannosidase 1B [Talaromyces proteolyticus]|uniref:alpha-1,2-Mannosidase n=1 Tax=Talaromyces proteolyticus TaxID=1131652 RepID=A0AAD4KUZ1_9EURO|nr:putative mannosyl-oligosaccharide alpha-1,2-mannosidase 1B [Talaromyces proteolyticus]KAH8696524.1 putative mannosyl-oligosaccharide alpha-1,2-mannosidase 1B [Talaromyces proteolyticus]
MRSETCWALLIVGVAGSAADRAAAVKQAFQLSWDAYYEHAFPHDQLKPISQSGDDSYGGWGATALDGLDTAIVMGNQVVVNQILDYVPTIDFSSCNQSSVSMFETTIRYLGGLLSAYDLLNGPAANLVNETSKVTNLLTQAASLADNLKVAFTSETGMPYNGIDIQNQTIVGEPTNGLAAIGSLVLEWTRLADLTGNAEYGNLSQKAAEYLFNPQPSWVSPWPGMVPDNLNISTGEFISDSISWDGGSDSYYEYLIKSYIYSPSRFSSYRDQWEEAVNSTIQNLMQNTTTGSGQNLTYVGTWNNGTFSATMGHLVSFIGGNFLLGGSVLQRQDLIDYGLALTEGWYAAYNSSATKIGPGALSWNATAAGDNGQTDTYDELGFYYTASSYMLRPETLESYYYAYRITGDEKYRDWSWEAFVGINSTCWTGSGYAEINNVDNTTQGGGFNDLQDSFLLAEVWKYAYLIQADDAEWQVSSNGTNSFVFNTEAHPIRVSGN